MILWKLTNLFIPLVFVYAIYLNLLEQIRESQEFDVDMVLLYNEDTDLQTLFSVAAKLREAGNVLTVSKVPENLHWRRLYQLREGEAVLVEDNG